MLKINHILYNDSQAFTLIELSIVLVIIGLVTGGVLVGSNLIDAASVRATITQIEKYNTAVNTFRGKFNELPGDITSSAASSYGLSTRSGSRGQGDGSGMIEGTNGAGSLMQGGGETGLFWVDLSSVAAGRLIEGTFNLATDSSAPSPSLKNLNQYMPPAKIGAGNYIYVFSNNSANWYGLSGATALASGVLTSAPALTVAQAYNIDKKMDDGLPQTGIVQAFYLDSALYWAAGGGGYSAGNVGASGTGPTFSSPTTCYDNGGNLGGQQTYSVQVSSGSNPNCALSFKFQ